jgi:hypothetical protein
VNGDLVPTKRAARNRYEAIRNDQGVDFLAYDFDSGLPENNALAIFGEESDLGFGADEGFSATGDSGGPIFINGAIAGVTAFGETLPAADVNDMLDASWGEASFDTRVSQFQDFIREATGGAARFVPDGDYNKDGGVDGSDFLIWQRQYGESDFPPSDGNGDGLVDAADYTVWRDNFGSTIPSSSAETAASGVPEPSAAMLMGLTMLICACQYRSFSGSTTPKFKYGRNLSAARVRKGVDRDRGEPCGSAPLTPPGIRFTYHGGSIGLSVGRFGYSRKANRIEIVIAQCLLHRRVSRHTPESRR